MDCHFRSHFYSGDKGFSERATWRQNRLLASLPEAEFERWRPYLELIELHLGQVLYGPGAELSYAYFPVTAIVTLQHVLENGTSTEIAVVGNDGLVGISLFMGGDTTPSKAVVRNAGAAYRLASRNLTSEFNRGGAVVHLLLRYTQALIAQMSQTAVCNRHHTVRQQLCRWLLLSLDRLPGNEIVTTQKLIANMLGVRSERVTAEAARLQAEGVIRYHGERITALDRSKLEASACECYAVVKKEYDRLLPTQVWKEGSRPYPRQSWLSPVYSDFGGFPCDNKQLESNGRASV
jgi:CRP-like cAMP-binding protein